MTFLTLYDITKTVDEFLLSIVVAALAAREWSSVVG
jgi:hypothetical protein